MYRHSSTRRQHKHIPDTRTYPCIAHYYRLKIARSRCLAQLVYYRYELLTALFRYHYYYIIIIIIISIRVYISYCVYGRCLAIQLSAARDRASLSRGVARVDKENTARRTQEADGTRLVVTALLLTFIAYLLNYLRERERKARECVRVCMYVRMCVCVCVKPCAIYGR